MNLFNLPDSTKVEKIIPKNAFDAYTNAKQKKLFADLVSRITWLNKVSPETINLAGKEVKEIQIFFIELKAKKEIQLLLDIIDKAIPYQIIFIVNYSDIVYLSTSAKHVHAINENNAVIDWTFKTSWFSANENKYIIHLTKNIDAVYSDFCFQLSDKVNAKNKKLQELITDEKQINSLRKDILKLKANIGKCKQFKQKVELNLQLKYIEEKLHILLNEK